MKALIFRIGAGGVVLLAALSAGVGSVVERVPERIVLEHADTLRSRGGERELIGKVRVRRGATVIRSDRALQNPAAGRVTLTGKVKMTEPGRILETSQLEYDERSGDFDAYGAVKMTQGDSVRINCQVARYRAVEKQLDLFDSLTIDNLKDGTRITGRHGWWVEDERLAMVEGDPVYSAPNPKASPPDTLEIRSYRLYYYQSQGSADFIGSVKFREGIITGESDTLNHQPDSNRTVLTGSPKIWREQDRLSGERIEIRYLENAVDKMVVQGDAVALTRAKEADDRWNRMTGDELVLTTLDDSTRSVDVKGGAKAFYHVWDEKGRYQGMNIAAADQMRITLVNDQATAIRLSGRTSGSFYPPGMAPMEVASGEERSNNRTGK